MADDGKRASRASKRPAARGTAFYPRQRANKACQVCRARKTKCDNKKPKCSYCETVGAACIQSDHDLSSFDPASLKILERLENIEKLLKEDKSGPKPEARNPKPEAATVIEHGEPVECLLQSVLPEKVEQILQWPCFSDGRGSDDLVGHTPNSADGSAEAPRISGAGLLNDLEPERINHLLDNFFTYAHCKNPVLDEVSTRKLVRRAFLDDGIDWSAESCLSLLIMAIGCLSGPFGPSPDVGPGSIPYRDSQFLFQAAQRRIGSLLSTFGIIGAQCFFLSGVYSMSVFQPLVAWRFFSQALAACQHFPFLVETQKDICSDVGLSPEDSAYGKMDVYAQAVYWSAWKSEQELRSYLKLPDFGNPDSGTTLYPPFFPTPPISQPNHSPGLLPEPHEQRARGAWLFYLAEISLRRLHTRLRSEILTLSRTYKSTRLLEMLRDMVPEYETQARDWAASLPDMFIFHGTNPADDDVCRSILRCHLINLFELIYWAGTVAAINLYDGNPLNMPNGVERMSFRGLEAHVDRLQSNEPGFMHRHHGTLFMIKCCSRSMFLLLAARAKGMQMPLGWTDAVYKGLGLMEYWATEVPELVMWKATAQYEFDKYLS